MAAPLSVCIKEEQCSVIQFLWSEGVSGAAIHQRLLEQYRSNVLLQWSVYEWTEKLKNGRRNVMHNKGARQPSTAITEDNIEHTHDIVLLDERLLMKWHMLCKLAMVRPTNWCTTNLGFIKSMHYGSQNNSQRCINKRAWTSAKNIWIAMVMNKTSS